MIKNTLFVGATITAFMVGYAHTLAWSADRQAGWVTAPTTQVDLDHVSRILREYETVRNQPIRAGLSTVRGRLALLVPGSDIRAGDKYRISKEEHNGVVRYSIYRVDGK